MEVFFSLFFLLEKWSIFTGNFYLVSYTFVWSAMIYEDQCPTISLISIDSFNFFKPPVHWNGESYVRYARNKIARSSRDVAIRSKLLCRISFRSKVTEVWNGSDQYETASIPPHSQGLTRLGHLSCFDLLSPSLTLRTSRRHLLRPGRKRHQAWWPVSAFYRRNQQGNSFRTWVWRLRIQIARARRLRTAWLWCELNSLVKDISLWETSQVHMELSKCMLKNKLELRISVRQTNIRVQHLATITSVDFEFSKKSPVADLTHFTQ